MQAFLSVASQWRTAALGAAGVEWLGLDYTAVRSGFRMAGIKVTPELWDQIRFVEWGACNALNGNEDYSP